MHVAETEADGSVLPALQAFQEFRKGLDDRTDEGPVVTELDRIGSFRLAGEPVA
jgi:hypothetical protein